MSKKSKKKRGFCGDCPHTLNACYVHYLVLEGGDRNIYPYRDVCPLAFFDWLGTLGERVCIHHRQSDFYEDYSFYVGDWEISAILPDWITDEMLSSRFGTTIIYPWSPWRCDDV